MGTMFAGGKMRILQLDLFTRIKIKVILRSQSFTNSVVDNYRPSGSFKL